MPFAGLDGLKSPYVFHIPEKPMPRQVGALVFLMSEWSVCIVLYLRFG